MPARISTSTRPLASGFWRDGAIAHSRPPTTRGRGDVKTPAIAGALIQLGHCSNLMDTFRDDDRGRRTAVASHTHANRLTRWTILATTR